MPRLFLVGEDMIIGIGTDIVEIDRVTKAIKGEAFVKRVFTPAEAEYCRSRKAGMAAYYEGLGYRPAGGKSYRVGNP